jgi:hypothetical protein
MSKNQKIGGARYIGLCLGVIACLGLVLTLQSGTARANIFPNDAKTISTRFTGNVTNEILIPFSKRFSVLYVSFSNSSTDPSATISLDCGGVNLLYVKNMNTNSNFERFETRQCDDNLMITTTSMGVAVNTSIKAIYVNYNLALVPNYLITLASVSVPSEPLLTASASLLTTYGTMTAGDILIALLLFGLAMLNLLTIFLRKI